MKNLKKILAVVLALTMVLATFSVFAEETKEIKVYEAKTAKFDNCLKDAKKWFIAEGKDVAFKNGKVTSNEAELIVFSYPEAFTNELVQMDISFNLVDEEGKGKWAGISVRSGATTARAWQQNANAYLFIVKSDRIELQRWNGAAQYVLDVVANDGFIKDDEAASISVGAVDTDNGVNVVLFVDDVCVMNVLDASEKAIKEGENISVYATEGTTVSKYTGPSKLPAVIVDPVISADETGFKLNAEYAVMTFGGADIKGDYKLAWYASKYEMGENLTEIQDSAYAEFTAVKYMPRGEYEALEVYGEEYELTVENVENYIRACVVDAEGNVIAKSNAYSIDRAKVYEMKLNNVLTSSVILKLENCNALVKGEKVQIDANDASIKPTTISDRTLVPVRFVAESFGAEVGWEEETQKVTIKLDDKEVVMTLGEKVYTVNGEEKTLDVPAMELGGRTRVPVRVISETFGKNVFWDEFYELIIISDTDFGLNSDDDVEMIYTIVRKL